MGCAASIQWCAGDCKASERIVPEGKRPAGDAVVVQPPSLQDGVQQTPPPPEQGEKEGGNPPINNGTARGGGSSGAPSPSDPASVTAPGA